jgi:hypothetical protein
MRHKHRHLVVLSTLAVLAFSITASAANATILYEWKVKGAALKTGESKEVTLKAKPKTVVKWAVNFPTLLFVGNINSSELQLTKAAKIIGGKPGEIEGELVFTGATYEPTKNKELFAHCTVDTLSSEPGVLRTVSLRGEVVESAEAKKGTGKTELLISPKTGEGLIEIHIGGKECAREIGYVVDGTMLAEMAPQKSEAKVTKLSFAKSGSEYRNAKEEFKTSVLESFGENQPIAGETELELVSKEAFGAF